MAMAMVKERKNEEVIDGETNRTYEERIKRMQRRAEIEGTTGKRWTRRGSGGVGTAAAAATERTATSLHPSSPAAAGEPKESCATTARGSSGSFARLGC